MNTFRSSKSELESRITRANYVVEEESKCEIMFGEIARKMREQMRANPDKHEKTIKCEKIQENTRLGRHQARKTREHARC